jgi:hypothetical protein
VRDARAASTIGSVVDMRAGKAAGMGRRLAEDGGLGKPRRYSAFAKHRAILRPGPLPSTAPGPSSSVSFALMDFGDRLDQRQAKPDTGQRARFLQSHKALQHPAALLGGNAWPSIGDRNLHLTFAGLAPAQHDRAALRRVFHGVVDEVGDRLRQQLAVAKVTIVLADNRS